MTRLLTLPITIPLRIVALQLRIARAAAGVALDVTRDLAGGSPLDRDRDRGVAADAPRAPSTPAAPRAAGPDPVEPVRQARRRAAVQKTRAQRRPPAAATATDVPPAAPEEAPRPRPRRAARKATAAKPARARRTGPTRGQAAAIREAQRESEGAAPVASAGPATGAGPEIRIEAPWEGYDAMALDEVLARLEGADDATVAAVRLYEGQHENRQAILLATETP
jgi:ribonuclease E